MIDDHLRQNLSHLLSDVEAGIAPRKVEHATPSSNAKTAQLRALLLAHHYQKALALGQALLAKHANHWEVMHLLAWACLGTNQNTQALPLLMSSAPHLPLESEAWRHLAMVLNRLGLHQEADRLYEVLLDRTSIDAPLLSNAAKNALALGKHHKAMAWCSQACTLQPGLAEGWNNLGNICKAQGRWQQALEAYQQALKIAPKLPAAHNNFGLVLKDLGRLDEAQVHFDRAIALAPSYLEAQCNFANLLHLQKKHEAAIALLQTILKDTPGLLEAHNTLALCLEAVGKPQAAIDIWRQIFTQQPNWIDAYLNAANLLRKHGQLDDALTLLERAVIVAPESPAVHNNLATLYKEMGETEAALKHFRLAIQALQSRPFKPLPRPKAYMDVSIAHQALLAFKGAMDSMGVPFFLAYGTLLGIIRDGDLLPHDKDMDVGLDWGVPRGQLLRDLCAQGFGIPELGLRATDADREWEMSVVHRETGIAIDLFFFKPEGGALYSGFNHRPTPLLWQFQKFDTKTIRYLDVEWSVPNPPERFLEDIYGVGWRTPDPYFDSIVSGCNRIPEAKQVALCFAYNRLFDRVDRGEWAKAAGYCRQIQKQQPDPFIDEVTAWLEARMRAENESQ